MDNDKKLLPYNVNLSLLLKIPDDLKSTGGEAMPLETLWQHLGVAKKLGNSYTLNAAEYLKLVEVESSKVKLTKLGKSVAYSSGNRRNELLILGLPEEYKTMTGWIIHEGGEISRTTLQSKFVDNFDALKPRMLLATLSTYLTYCVSIELLQYAGRGDDAKVVLTAFGKKTLESATSTPLQEEQSKVNSPQVQQQGSTQPVQNQPTTEDYDFVILVKGMKPIKIDVETPEDIATLSAHMKALIAKWRKAHDIVDDSKAEGEQNEHSQS